MFKIKRKKKFICIKEGLTNIDKGDHMTIKEIAYMDAYGIQISNGFLPNVWISAETLHEYFKPIKTNKKKDKKCGKS